MSCILLHHSHHEALAGAWFAFSDRHFRPSFPYRFEINKTPTEFDVAKILAAENGRAYSDRYETQNRDTKRISTADEAVALVHHREPAEWAYRIADRKVSIAQVLKWLQSYEYQTSDSKTYKGSAAEYVVEAIRSLAVQHLDGYEEATWTCEGFTPAQTEARNV